MQEQDWSRFRELMGHAANLTAMPNGKNLEDVTAAMFAALAGYPLAEVASAVGQCCREERFFPMLADIVRRIEGDMDERAALAWAEVDDAARRTGGDRSVRFSDPAIHWAVEKMRGWDWLGWKVRHDGAWLKRDFEQYYRIAARRRVTWADVPAVLDGTFRDAVYLASTRRSVPARELPALVEAAS